MPRKPWPYGKSVVDGRVRFLAPTTIAKADASAGGCLRKWHYRYVMGWKEEERSWQELGNQCHAEIENYLLTGENTLGRISSAAARFIPQPDPGRKRLLIEHDIGGGDLSKAKLHAAGVPIVGYCDVIHDDPALDENAEPCGDPKGTIEVLDWKFGGERIDSDRCYAKKPFELTTDIQMIAEGEWVNRVDPRNAPIRLSHVYTNTKGRPQSSKATVLMDRSKIAQRWEVIEAVTRSIVDVAKEIDPERVPGNANACDSFGGCAYREKCSAYSVASLESFFGGEGALGLLESLDLKEKTSMGLADVLNIPGLAPTTPPPVAPVPVVANASGVAAVIGGHSIAAQMAALGVAQQPQQPQWPQGFPEAVDEILSKGYGFPPIKDAAATAYAKLMLSRGQQAYANGPYGPFTGTGDLARTDWVSDPARIIGIAQEMRPLAPKATPAPVTPASVQAQPMTSVLPPDAPTSNPMLAADPVPGFTPPNATTPQVQVPGLIASVPPAAAAAVLANNAPAVAAQAATPPAPEPKKRGRKPKDTTATTSANNTGAEVATVDGSWLFVDCRPNIAHTDLQEAIDVWALGIGKHFKCDYNDVRLAAKDSSLGYGGWRGAISGVAAQAAKTLPAGAYYVDTRGSDINDAALEGLRGARHDDGSPVFEMIVRGVR